MCSDRTRYRLWLAHASISCSWNSGLWPLICSSVLTRIYSAARLFGIPMGSIISDIVNSRRIIRAWFLEKTRKVFALTGQNMEDMIECGHDIAPIIRVDE